MQLSIIIPAYNAAAFLERSIQSALRAGSQVPGQWELLLVDNNSTDDSRAIMEAFERQHPQHIRTLTALKQGAPSARNEGLRVATGEWVQFLDADDYLLDTKIAAQLALTDASTDWVIGAYRNRYIDGTTDNSIPHLDPWRGLAHDLLIGNTNSNLYRRSALTAAGNWNEATPAFDDPNLHFSLLRNDVNYVIDPAIRSYYWHHTGPRVTSVDFVGQNQQAANLLIELNTYLSTTRPTYWQSHAPFFLGALLRKLRTLATYDLGAATLAYQTHFGPTSPWSQYPPFELVPQYTRLYPYLGFQTLESARLILTHYLPPTLKELLKS